VLVPGAAAVSGVPAPAVRLPRVTGGRFGVRGRRLTLRVVVRSVGMTAAAMHEEHRDRAGEEEKQKDEGRCAHGVPPFVACPKLRPPP
jgi:hypothetical protein